MKPQFYEAGKFLNGIAEVTIYRSYRPRQKYQNLKNTNLGNAAFADAATYENFENSMPADKKQPVRIFSIVLLILVSLQAYQ